MYRLCIIFQPILRFFVKHSLFSKWMPSSGRFHDGVRETCFVFQLISWSPRRNAGRMGPEFCRGKNVKHTSGRVYLKGVLTRHHSWTSVHKKNNLPKSFRNCSSNGPAEFFNTLGAHFCISPQAEADSVGFPWFSWFLGPPVFYKIVSKLWSSNFGAWHR